MESNTIFKIRKVSTYILPFISSAIVSLIIEFIGNSILNMDNLLAKYLLDVFMVFVCSIIFIVVGYYIEPENKTKAIKYLSIISCIISLVAFYGYQSEFIQPTISIITTIVIYLILNKVESKKISDVM